MRFGYTLDEVRNPSRIGDPDPTLARCEVDVDAIGPEHLREELRPWALERLAESSRELGLYTAEFGSWRDDRRPAYYLRQLYIVWSGDEALTVHVDDSPVNFAGVRALTRQAEAFESVHPVTTVGPRATGW